MPPIKRPMSTVGLVMDRSMLRDGSICLHLINIGRYQGQGRKRGGTNGKSLACGSRGVAQGIQCIGSLTHLLRHVRHLCNTARIIGNRSVSIGCQGNAQGGQHAHCGHAHAVKPCIEISTAA